MLGLFLNASTCLTWLSAIVRPLRVGGGRVFAQSDRGRVVGQRALEDWDWTEELSGRRHFAEARVTVYRAAEVDICLVLMAPVELSL